MELKEMLAAQAKEAHYALNMHMEVGNLNGISNEHEPRWNGIVQVRGRHVWFGFHVVNADSGSWGHIWVTAEGELSSAAEPVSGM